MVQSIQGSSQANFSFLPDQRELALDLGGDASAELAAMVFLFSRERSKDAAVTRDHLEQGIQAQQEAQIDKLYDAADAQFAAALATGLSSIAGGVCSAVTPFLGAKAGGIVQGATAVEQGHLKMVEGYLTQQASRLEADATAAENQANTGIRALETVQQDRADAQDMKQRTLDFLGAIEESKAEANKALVNIRA